MPEPGPEALHTSGDVSVTTQSPTGSFHYGWMIVAMGALVLFSCFGLGRFAYTVLVPSMQAGLGLSYEHMGFVGTANFMGYLTAVLIAPLLMRGISPRLTISLSLALIAGCMVGISRSHSFAQVACLYSTIGVGSGFSNILMMTLVTYWFHSERRGRAAGLAIFGNGVGIMFAGFLIPLLNQSYGTDGWRISWVVLGGLSMAAALCAGVFLRNKPSDLGLEPVGRSAPVSPDLVLPRKRRDDAWILVRLGLLYLVFGATFMVYGTFIVTTLVREYGFTEQRAGLYWSWVGFFSLFSGVGFGTLSDRIGRKRGLALVFSVQTVAYLLVGLRPGSVGLMISIVLYGLAVFAIPAIMAAAVGDYLGLSRAATSFATVTLFFAAGQTIGPGAAGLVAKTLGSFCPAYVAASALTAAACVLALTLPPPPQR